MNCSQCSVCKNVAFKKCIFYVEHRAFDLECMTFDLEHTAFDLESMAFDLGHITFYLECMNFDLEHMTFDCSLLRPRRRVKHKMRPIAIALAWSLSVCLSITAVSRA